MVTFRPAPESGCCSSAAASRSAPRRPTPRRQLQLRSGSSRSSASWAPISRVAGCARPLESRRTSPPPTSSFSQAPRTRTGLPTRQHEALGLPREGLVTAEIAARLGLAPVTVRRHVWLVLEKLGASDRAEALRLVEEGEREGAG